MSTTTHAMRRGLIAGAAALALPLCLAALPAQADPINRVLPMPALDVPAATGSQTATFAGGCFWGTQAVFQHVTGVTNAVSGYAGGARADADYPHVKTGTTQHAESVRVTFDPAKVTYGKLLQIFFSVALDPTQVDQQGNDIGHEYRSVLFISDPAQERVARAYIAQLDAAHVFAGPIATRIDTTSPFYVAEHYHQDYLQLNPTVPYIVTNDMPLVTSLHALFPEVWRDTPITTQEVASAN